MLRAAWLTEQLTVPASWQSRAAACRMLRLPQAKQLLGLWKLQVSVSPAYLCMCISLSRPNSTEKGYGAARVFPQSCKALILSYSCVCGV